jgi:MoxR-like ATPase
MGGSSLANRFGELSAALGSEHFERGAEIQCALLALVSGTTFLMIGEPGIAKSQLIRRLAVRIDGAEFFEHAMDKFTVPDDVFGPRSLSAMQRDSWERVIDHTLVTADFAMLDEFFEANSAMLKSLLRGLYERTFRQGTEIIPMRLTTVFAASNAAPTDPRLAALYDRLILRRQLHRITGAANFVRLLECELDPKPPAIMSWADVALAQHDAAQLTVPSSLLATIADIRIQLTKLNVFPSDRRFVEALKVVRAAAWLDGCSEAEPEHLRCLSDVLWIHPDQYDAVSTTIDRVLEPLVFGADELICAVGEIVDQIRTDLDTPDRKRLGTELHDKLRRADRELQALRAKTPTAYQQRRLGVADQAIRDATATVMRDLFLVDVATLENTQ